MRVRTAVLVMTLMGAVACSPSVGDEENSPRGLSGTCGLPTPDPEPDRDDSLVPEVFLPSGAEIAKAEAERGGFVTAINVPLSVQEAFDFYKVAASEGGYETIQTDNEGFEAEIYLRHGKRLAAIQVRTSTCEDRSIVFVNEIVPKEP